MYTIISLCFFIQSKAKSMHLLLCLQGQQSPAAWACKNKTKCTTKFFSPTTFRRAVTGMTYVGKTVPMYWACRCLLVVPCRNSSLWIHLAAVVPPSISLFFFSLDMSYMYPGFQLFSKGLFVSCTWSAKAFVQTQPIVPTINFFQINVVIYSKTSWCRLSIRM